MLLEGKNELFLNSVNNFDISTRIKKIVIYISINKSTILKLTKAK